MRVKALTLRILWQMRRDKRTLALMLVAPLFVLTLGWLVFSGAEHQLAVGIVNAPDAYVRALSQQNLKVYRCDEAGAREALESGEFTAAAAMNSGKLYISVDGTDSALATQAVSVLTLAQAEMVQAGRAVSRPELQPEVTYVYGSRDMSQFDHLGPLLIGFIIFFYVFLVAGISFLQERNTGTLEKLLSSPIRRWEIVAGYVLGFGIFTVLQAILISAYVVYVLDVLMAGSFLLVILVTILTAVNALALGILLSTAAANEFQLIQFIPVVIVPQVFFSGLFQLSPGLTWVERFMPLYYVADALKSVMIRGAGIGEIWVDLAVLGVCAAVFMTGNVLLLKKYRRL